MIRKIFCYSILLIESLLLKYVIYCFIKAPNFNYKLFEISMDLLILNIVPLIYSVLLFGAPNNNYNEYVIKNISYNDILKKNNIIVVTFNKNNWEFLCKGRCYKFNFNGWFNVKKRVSDLIFIQYHNNYCDAKKVKDKDYYKNYFKKYNIKIEFVNKKKYTKKFRPSYILKLKMIISCSQFQHQRYHLNDVKKRDLWDTYRVIKILKNKKRNK